MEKHAGAKVTVTATPESGAPPLTVALKGTVKLPEGRTLASYHWDFGDNDKPSGTEGADAQHAYARAGAYTAHLTVTDDKGDTTTGSVRITVK